MIDWLYSNALGATVLAVIAGILIWTFRPGPTVRHALWLVVLLKLISPTGLWVSVPLPVEGPAIEEPVAPPSPSVPELEDVMIGEEETFTVVLSPAQLEGHVCGDCPNAVGVGAVRIDTDEAPAVAAVESGEPFDYRPWLIGAWVLGAGYFGYRAVRESVRFSRFVRRSVPAGDHLRGEVVAVARKLGVRAPAVRVLAGLSSPVMWCLGRPVLLWPAGLDARLKGEGRLAVIAHELAHLRRRDHWVRRLEMVAAVLHWWNPLFWVARKRLRADAELACDAWAAGQADRRAYAEALLEVCSFNHRRRPAPAVGVSGEGRRDMQERLTMIMRERAPTRLAFGAKLVVALMAVAAVPAWTLGQSKPVKVEAAGDPEVQKIEEQLKALTQKLEAVRAAKAAEAEAKKAEAAAKAKATLLKTYQSKDVLVEKVHGAPNVKVLTAGQDGVKVIGADGKELKDVRVIIVEQHGAGKATATTTTEGPAKVQLRMATPNTTKVAPATAEKAALEFRLATVPGGQGTFKVAPAGDFYKVQGTVAGEGGQSVTLSRATYKLEKGQADALAGLLGNVKASILEVKVDGNTLTLTTTPDVQATVGQIVRLISGQATGTRNVYTFAPTAPGKPPAIAAPVPPAPPAPPAPPTPPAKPVKPVKPTAQGGQNNPVEVEVVPAGQNRAREIRVEVLKDLAELDKLKELKDLKQLKELKDLKIELNLDELKDLKIDPVELKARIEKVIESVKPTEEKKPARPAK